MLRTRYCRLAFGVLAIAGITPAAQAESFQLSCTGRDFNVPLIVTVNEDAKTVTTSFEGNSSGDGPFSAEITPQSIKWTANGAQHFINRMTGHYIDREPDASFTYQWDCKLVEPNAKPKF